MNVWHYLLTLVIIYAGLFVGLIIAHFTKEELPTGRKYFPLMQKILMVFIACVVLILVRWPVWGYLLLMAFVIANALYFKPWLNYASFGVLLSFLINNQKAFLLAASIMLFYGFVTGSLKLKTKNMLLHNCTIFIGIIIYFLL